MKSLFKTIIKFVFCILFPLVMITLTGYLSLYARVEMNMLSELVLYICTLTVCINAVFWFAMMQKTRMFPKISFEKWVGFGLGLGWADSKSKTFLLILPFVILEMSW